MTTFNPAAFSTSSIPHHIDVCFSGPVDTNKRLPKINKKISVLGTDVYLIGYRGKVGCFSVRKDAGSNLDVAFYPDVTPDDLSVKDLTNAIYETIECVPGWGFAAINSLRKLMSK